MQKPETLRQFVNSWWDAGEPQQPIARRKCRGSHETVIYRLDQFQIEIIDLYADFEIPPHRHPNVETIETHLYGHGEAWVAGRKLKVYPDYDKPARARRLYIGPNDVHSGVAYIPTRGLSFQHWLNGIKPTFITDNWIGVPWG